MIGILLAAAIAVAQPASALPPASTGAAAVDPAALSAARRLLAATDIRGQMRDLMPQIVDAAMAQVGQAFKSKAIPEGLTEQLREVMRRELSSFGDVYTPDVLDRMAQAYATHLSAADLSHVADMMADPAMARFRQQTPAIMRDSMPVLMAAIAPKQQALMQAMMKTVADWVRDHPADKLRLAKPVAS